MNLLDENIAEPQRSFLRRWRIPVRQIGRDVGRKSMKDDEIIRLLLELRRPTFFTLDSDFCDPELCHGRYCLVWLDVQEAEVAEFVRCLLRHPQCKTQAKRLGYVIAVAPSGITIWRSREARPTHAVWTD